VDCIISKICNEPDDDDVVIALLRGHDQNEMTEELSSNETHSRFDNFSKFVDDTED